MRVLRGDTGGDHADLRAVALDSVVGAVARVFLHLREQLLAHDMALSGHGGQQRELVEISFIGLHAHVLSRAGLHKALGVAHARGHAQEHRHVEALAELKGGLGVVQALLRVGGLQHADLGMGREQAVVLLILGAVTAGVVRADDDEAAAHAGVAHREDRIGGHVHADVLHCAQGARAADGRAGDELRRHLLIAGPFAIDVALVLGDVFQDLCARRAGIRRRDRAARLPGAPRNGLVPAENRFAHCLHLSSRFSWIAYVSNLYS